MKGILFENIWKNCINDNWVKFLFNSILTILHKYIMSSNFKHNRKVTNLIEILMLI